MSELKTCAPNLRESSRCYNCKFRTPFWNKNKEPDFIIRCKKHKGSSINNDMVCDSFIIEGNI